MIVHVKSLSLWEIAHYWHGLDPRQSTTHRVPLKARDTLLVLAMWCSKKIAYRVEREKSYLMEALKQAPRFTARHYRSTFKKAIDSKVFGKQFFSSLRIGRSQLARLCIQHNEPLPEFWFPDNEKYPFLMAGDVGELTANGRYELILIYDDSDEPAENTAPEHPISVTVTVNENAVKAAQASHAPINAIKARFVSFHESEGHTFKSKAAAARSFFDSLHDTEEKLLFDHKDAATRTLLDALREYRKNAK